MEIVHGLIVLYVMKVRYASSTSKHTAGLNQGR